jgi:hypothetical protein
VLWISSGNVVTKGGGKFEGSQGMKNSGICILIPEGESLQTATKVTFKSIDVFVLLRQEFIGQLPEPSPSS